MYRAIGMFLLFLASNAWSAPTVTLTAPTNGNLYVAPATFAVKANAASPGATVSQVEFFANGLSIGVDTNSPYQFDWSNATAGTYSITAVVTDSNGAQATSAPRSVTVAATNTAPTVSVTTPADNARYLNPLSVTLSANASGPELNDILQKVDFYLNGSLANTVTSAPFSYAATGLSPGTYTLTAVATDSQGAQTTSSQRTFIVSSTNEPPTVSLVTPLDSSAWNGPMATVPMSVSVNSGEANDTVSVEFFANGNSLGVRPNAPYSITANLASATYSITVVATDGQGAQTTSAARTIVVSDTNNPPTVTITAPVANTNYATAPANFTLTATAGAGEVNGWVSKVEFYVNGSLANTDTAGPWSFPVSALANGVYTLTAKAFDNFNASTTSAPVTVTVGPQPKLGFIHIDHLNTPRAIYDDQPQLRWKWDQAEPFGVSSPDDSPIALGQFDFPLRFPGQYFEKESGLSQNLYRDFWNEGARYLQSDPVGIKAGLNTYAYADLRPLAMIDPEGLQATPPPPGNIPGGPWTWSPNANNSRGGAFTGPNNASASWDPKYQHWDVDDGKGSRQRYNRWGKPLTPQQAHNYRGPKQRPLLRGPSFLMCLPIAFGYCQQNPGDPACIFLGFDVCDADPSMCL